MVITWSCVFTFAGVLEVHLRILVAFGYFIPSCYGAEAALVNPV